MKRIRKASTDYYSLQFQDDSKIDLGNSGDIIESTIIANQRFSCDIPKGVAFIYVHQIAFQISGKLPNELIGSAQSLSTILKKAQTILQNSIINN